MKHGVLRGWLSGGFRRANPKSMTLISKLSFSSVNNKFCKTQTLKLVSHWNVMGLGDAVYVNYLHTDTGPGTERVCWGFWELDISVPVLSALYLFVLFQFYRVMCDSLSTAPCPVWCQSLCLCLSRTLTSSINLSLPSWPCAPAPHSEIPPNSVTRLKSGLLNFLLALFTLPSWHLSPLHS